MEWLPIGDVASRLAVTEPEAAELLADPANGLTATGGMVSEADLGAWIESRTYRVTGRDDPRLAGLREEL